MLGEETLLLDSFPESQKPLSIAEFITGPIHFRVTHVQGRFFTFIVMPALEGGSQEYQSVSRLL